MTEPFYNCDLYPGMIADYEIADTKYCFETTLHKWLDQNMEWPFVVKGPSTAHWPVHVQVSNKDDEERLKANFEVVLTTTSHSGWGKNDIPQGRITHEQYIQQQARDVYYGVAGLYNIMEYLTKHPIPVNRIGVMIQIIEHWTDKNRKKHK